MRFETNYPQKLWISQGLTNLEGNGRSRLEVDWLFFAQDDSVTESRYRTDWPGKPPAPSHIISLLAEHEPTA
jgi:hypothetical protein